MSFSQQSLSSFTPYREPKSPNFFGSDFDFNQFNRLSLNSHENDSSGNHSQRSNASLGLKKQGSLKLFENQSHKNFDMLSVRSHNRKKPLSIGIKASQPGNMTFLNHSFVGKSQLNNYQQFNFNEIGQLPQLQKQLSQKSCPVRNEQFVLEQKKSHQEGYNHNDDIHYMDKNKACKKFKKTKNYLRTLSSYLHKNIKFNKKVKDLILNYYILKHKNSNIDEENDYRNLQEEAQEFYAEFIQWINGLNMINFQEYQKVWTTQNKFRSIYRQLSYKYYVEQAFCDIQRSRISSKLLLQQYLPQFIQGLINPKQFTHFKNQ